MDMDAVVVVVVGNDGSIMVVAVMVFFNGDYGMLICVAIVVVAGSG